VFLSIVLFDSIHPLNKFGEFRDDDFNECQNSVGTGIHEVTISQIVTSDIACRQHLLEK